MYVLDYKTTAPAALSNSDEFKKNNCILLCHLFSTKLKIWQFRLVDGNCDSIVKMSFSKKTFTLSYIITNIIYHIFYVKQLYKRPKISKNNSNACSKYITFDNWIHNLNIDSIWMYFWIWRMKSINRSHILSMSWNATEICDGHFWGKSLADNVSG